MLLYYDVDTMPELNNNTIRLMADASMELLARLEVDRADLVAKLATIDDKMTGLKRTINELNKLKGENALPGDVTARKPKGANREAIRNLFASKPGAQLTVQEIMDGTKMPRSSVQAALAQMKDTELERDQENRWRQKGSAKTPSQKTDSLIG